MFSDLSLLGCDPISNPRVKYPQRSQRIGHGRGRGFYFNLAVPISEFAQGTRDVKGYRYDSPLSRTRFVGGVLYVEVRRDLLVTGDFVRDEVEPDALGELGSESPDACSKTALRTQTIEGSPSRIFCQFLPSSREPKI